MFPSVFLPSLFTVIRPPPLFLAALLLSLCKPYCPGFPHHHNTTIMSALLCLSKRMLCFLPFNGSMYSVLKPNMERTGFAHSSLQFSSACAQVHK